MKRKRVCKISYQAIMETKPKTHAILPLKLFSHKDTIYLHARIHIANGRKGKEMEFDPLLAVHRIRKAEMTDAIYKYPEDYNFEKIYNKNFGIIKDEAFKVVVEFTGWAARYVSERIWSPDQKIEKAGKNKILLEFTASSEPEIISWVLSFGEEARLINPDWLAETMGRKVRSMAPLYNNRK